MGTVASLTRNIWPNCWVFCCCWFGGWGAYYWDGRWDCRCLSAAAVADAVLEAESGLAGVGAQGLRPGGLRT